MTQGQQKRLHYFSPALPRWWEAAVGEDSPQLMSHSDCSISSRAQQGQDSVDAFQCPGKVPGPSGIQLMVFSKASMSQSCNPWQAGRQTDSKYSGISSRVPCFAGIYQLQTPSSCPELSPAIPRTLCTSETQPLLFTPCPNQHKHPHPATGCSCHHDTITPPSGPVSSNFPVVERTNKGQGIVLETQHYLTVTLQTLIKGDWELQSCSH